MILHESKHVKIEAHKNSKKEMVIQALEWIAVIGLIGGVIWWLN